MGNKPDKKKKNNTVKLVTSHTLQSGDVIIGEYGPQGVSKWMVKEIVSSRQSVFKDKNYIELKTDYKRVDPKEFKGFDLENCSLSLKIFIDKI